MEILFSLLLMILVWIIFETQTVDIKIISSISLRVLFLGVTDFANKTRLYGWWKFACKQKENCTYVQAKLFYVVFLLYSIQWFLFTNKYNIMSHSWSLRLNKFFLSYFSGLMSLVKHRCSYKFFLSQAHKEFSAIKGEH